MILGPIILLPGLILCQSGVISSSSGVISTSFDFSDFPAPLEPAPANLNFTRRYDLSRLVNVPVASPPASRGPVNCPSGGGCSWGCDHCLRPTDILFCPSNRDWGFSFDDGNTILDI